jgi:hypothetical protein
MFDHKLFVWIPSGGGLEDVVQIEELDHKQRRWELYWSYKNGRLTIKGLQSLRNCRIHEPKR